MNFEMSDRFNIDGNAGVDQAEADSNDLNDKSKSMMHTFKADQFPFTHLMSSSAAVNSNKRKLVRNKLILNGSL